jgi:tetratricopeptide (TPR) repeat protein
MRAALLALTLFTCTSPLAAARSDRVTAWVKEAERLYRAHKYQEAAALLIKAQSEEPNPRLTYDIAVAYEKAAELSGKAADLEKAREYYQAYMDTPNGTDALLLQRATLALDHLRELRKAQEKPQETPEQRRTRELQEARDRSAAESSRESHDMAMMQTWALGGGAVVALGAGVTFALSAQRAKDQFSKASTVPSKQAWQTATSLRAGLADASFAVALAAGLAAAWVYPKDRPVTATVGPLLTAGGGGLMAQVRY